jgi:hypothetical protein
MGENAPVELVFSALRIGGDGDGGPVFERHGFVEGNAGAADAC